MWTILLALSIAAMRVGAAPAQVTLHQFAPTPAWVDPATPHYDLAAPATVATGGTWFLLFDRQINVRPAGHDYYAHVAIKLLTAGAVEEQATINLSVDPTYQSMQIHQLRVWRGGSPIEQQHSAKFTELPEETELQNRVYNGTYNVNILLADVRVGDVVEYSYTIRSDDRPYPGHFAVRLLTGWSNPVHLQRFRLLAPATRKIRYRMSDGAVLPTQRITDNTLELRFEQSDISAVPADEDQPRWYAPWPYIEISDLDSWPRVAELAGRLYAVPHEAGERAASVARSIKAGGGSLQDQALRALQFVQEHIRYTSIPIQPGDYRAADPEDVLARRYGDCKDKSILLTTLLSELGIEAVTALAHTRRGRVLADALPTPFAFNHMIVRAQIDDQIYWLDGTTPKRYSPLSTTDPPDLERALPLDARARGLETIPRPGPDTRREEVLLSLDARSGVAAPGAVELTTRYFGTRADQMRPVLARETPEQRQSNYINYLARFVTGVKANGQITIADNTATNVVEIREHYRLDSAFAKEGNGRRALHLLAHEVRRFATTLGSTVRRAPLAIEYPIEMREVISVALPRAWDLQPDNVTVDNPAFSYHSTAKYADRTLTLTYDYKALTDEVSPALLEAYVKDRDRVYDDLGYNLVDEPQSAKPRRFAVAPAPFLTILVSVALGVWASRRWLYRYDPPPARPPADAPVGIAGWLILPALNVVLAPVLLLVLMGAYAIFIDADAWYGIPTAVPKALSDWAQPLFLVLAALGGLLLVLDGTSTILFFKRRTSAPTVFVALSWVRVAYLALLIPFFAEFTANTNAATPSQTIHWLPEGLRAIIWTVYMVRSKRVGATFTERLERAVHAKPATVS